jgi:hypothetical protein
MASVMFLWYTQQLLFFRTIPYNSVKRNQVLLKYDYMFQPKKTIIRPTLQKPLKQATIQCSCVRYMASNMAYSGCYNDKFIKNFCHIEFI